MQAVEPVVSYFDAPFTGASNNLLKEVYTDPDVPPKIKLLLLITRFSTGFLKLDTILKESFIIEQTGMSKSSLYKAKADLVAAKRITIRHTKNGNCVYRLADHLQALKGAVRPPTSAAGEGGTSAHTEVPLYKENKENLNIYQHHQATRFDDDFQTITSNDNGNWRELGFGLLSDESTPAPAPDQANELVTLQPHTQEQAISCAQGLEKVPPAPRTDSKPVSSLTRQLLDVGVNQFLARRLVQTNSEELIQAALARLQVSTAVRNPAGYLVAELSRGGYVAPVVDPLRQAKEKHEKIHEVRQQERSREQAEREAANVAMVTKPLTLFESLPQMDQEAILAALDAQAEAERFTRVSGWSAEHPLYKGLLAEITQRFALENETRASICSDTCLPSRAGESDPMAARWPLLDRAAGDPRCF